MTQKTDIYQSVTDQIVKAIEDGAGKWTMPWHQSFSIPANATTRKRYRGINILNLWAVAQGKGYDIPLWATYAQWHAAGAQVKKGEKAALVVFWKFFDKETQEDAETETGSDTARRAPMARFYPVFNAAQVDGFTPPPPPAPLTESRDEDAEQFFANLGATIRHGGGQAFYCPSSDHIQMPPFESFHSAVAYYSTLAHESTHWSGAGHRLDRDLKHRFGSEAYAAEELVAELGAAFLCADLGITPEPRPDHAAYIETWLKVLKNDKRAIFTAASHAQKAADYLNALQPTASQQQEETEAA